LQKINLNLITFYFLSLWWTYIFHSHIIQSILSAAFSTKHHKYVRPTNTIILECPYRSQEGNVVQWLYSNSTNGTFLTISNNEVISPQYGSDHSFVIIKNITGGGVYDLQISNVTTANEGIYRCSSQNKTTNKPVQTDLVLRMIRMYI